MNYTEFIGVSQDISGRRIRLLPPFSKPYLSEVVLSFVVTLGQALQKMARVYSQQSLLKTHRIKQYIIGKERHDNSGEDEEGKKR